MTSAETRTNPPAPPDGVGIIRKLEAEGHLTIVSIDVGDGPRWVGHDLDPDFDPRTEFDPIADEDRIDALYPA